MLDSLFLLYLFTVSLGIIFSEASIFENILEIIQTKGRKLAVFFIATLGFCGMIGIRMATGVEFVSTVDAFATVFICLIVIVCKNKIIKVNFLLEKIGEHSMNLFLMHTFIKAYYFPNIIYSWKYPILIIMALLLVTMFLSIVIERVKKAICYDVLINQMSNHVQKLMRW